MDTAGFEHLKVSTEDDGRVVVLELDHGKANEMGSAQLRELEQLTARLRADDRAVALITFSRKTSGKGTPIFVAGANVTERVGWPDDRVKAHVSWQREVLGALRAAPVFHVAVANGVALGWGTEYMLVADYRIASREATFGLPETGLGIVPGAGGTAELWAHLGVAQTLRLGMTGERIDATEAKRIGLVQEVAVDVDSALTRARALAGLAAKRSPTAIAAFKDGVLRSVGSPPHERTRIEAGIYAHCVDSGQASVGRQHFAELTKGGDAPWGPRVPLENES